MIDTTKWMGLFLAGGLLSFAIWQYNVLRRRRAVTEAKKGRMTAELYQFLDKQTKRRFSMSVLFGLAGVGMLVGCSFAPRDYPRLFLSVWGTVLCFLVWGMFLALLDSIAVRLHYDLEKRQTEAEKIGLEYTIKQARSPKNDPSKK